MIAESVVLSIRIIIEIIQRYDGRGRSGCTYVPTTRPTCDTAKSRNTYSSSRQCSRKKNEGTRQQRPIYTPCGHLKASAGKRVSSSGNRGGGRCRVLLLPSGDEFKRICLTGEVENNFYSAVYARFGDDFFFCHGTSPACLKSLSQINDQYLTYFDNLTL